MESSTIGAHQVKSLAELVQQVGAEPMQRNAYVSGAVQRLMESKAVDGNIKAKSAIVLYILLSQFYSPDGLYAHLLQGNGSNGNNYRLAY